MKAVGGRALRDALRRHPYHLALAAVAAGLACAPAPPELAPARRRGVARARPCARLPAQAALAVVLVLAGSLAGAARLRTLEPVPAVEIGDVEAAPQIPDHSLEEAKSFIAGFLQLDDFEQWHPSQHVRIKLIAPDFPRRGATDGEVARRRV